MLHRIVLANVAWCKRNIILCAPPCNHIVDHYINKNKKLLVAWDKWEWSMWLKSCYYANTWNWNLLQHMLQHPPCLAQHHHNWPYSLWSTQKQTSRHSVNPCSTTFQYGWCQGPTTVFSMESLHIWYRNQPLSIISLCCGVAFYSIHLAVHATVWQKHFIQYTMLPCSVSTFFTDATINDHIKYRPAEAVCIWSTQAQLGHAFGPHHGSSTWWCNWGHCQTSLFLGDLSRCWNGMGDRLWWQSQQSLVINLPSLIGQATVVVKCNKLSNKFCIFVLDSHTNYHDCAHVELCQKYCLDAVIPCINQKLYREKWGSMTSIYPGLGKLSDC